MAWVLITDANIDVLRQPLQTSITIDNLDFEEFKVEEQLHIGISVKDFKAIVTHAETLKTSITALHSFPTRPMQLSYHEHGMQCEFTLMTIGDYRGGSVTPAPAAARQKSATPAERAPSRHSTAQTAVQPKTTIMPPPSQPLSRSFTREPQSQRTQRPSPPPPKASLDPESLFLPADEDDDRIWGERNYDDEQDTLGWNASANNVNHLVVVRAVNSQQIRVHIWAIEERTRKALRGYHHIRLGRKKTQTAAYRQRKRSPKHAEPSSPIWIFFASWYHSRSKACLVTEISLPMGLMLREFGRPIRLSCAI